METIEERANYFVGSPFRMGETVRETYQRNGYIVGAHDQRGIDVERACQWFEKYLADIGYPDDWCRVSDNQVSGAERFREYMYKED